MKVHRELTGPGTTALLLLVLLAAGCALSPLRVMVAPEIAGSGEAIAGQPPVSLLVRDRRGASLIGHRGGVYDATSTIHSQNDVGPEVERALAEALRARGCRIPPEPGAVTTRLVVDVLALGYQAEGALSPHDVELHAEVVANLEKGTRRLERRFAHKETRTMLSAPDDAETAAMVNAVLVKVLTRLVDDTQLREFIAQ